MSSNRPLRSLDLIQGHEPGTHPPQQPAARFVHPQDRQAGQDLLATHGKNDADRAARPTRSDTAHGQNRVKGLDVDRRAQARKSRASESKHSEHGAVLTAGHAREARDLTAECSARHPYMRTNPFKLMARRQGCTRPKRAQENPRAAARTTPASGTARGCRQAACTAACARDAAAGADMRTRRRAAQSPAGDVHGYTDPSSPPEVGRQPTAAGRRPDALRTQEPAAAAASTRCVRRTDRPRRRDPASTSKRQRDGRRLAAAELCAGRTRAAGLRGAVDASVRSDGRSWSSCSRGVRPCRPCRSAFAAEDAARGVALIFAFSAIGFDLRRTAHRATLHRLQPARRAPASPSDVLRPFRGRRVHWPAAKHAERRTAPPARSLPRGPAPGPQRAQHRTRRRRPGSPRTSRRGRRTNSHDARDRDPRVPAAAVHDAPRRRCTRRPCAGGCPRRRLDFPASRERRGVGAGGSDALARARGPGRRLASRASHGRVSRDTPRACSALPSRPRRPC
ncbi:hypothetical protein PsYK624_065460 [Phanerochaete sordida]|uniref:Uncharacterized protein n=1 Tax=Phanerochaete sordida TaxID=48140 RepID=A0A9P3LDB5_9APHY|nr:hypothetical protein PsYK624_065460 [Phanerochaete sordida]